MQVLFVFVLGAKSAETVHKVRELFSRLVSEMPAVDVLHDAIKIRLDRVRAESERLNGLVMLRESSKQSLEPLWLIDKIFDGMHPLNSALTFRLFGLAYLRLLVV